MIQILPLTELRHLRLQPVLRERGCQRGGPSGQTRRSHEVLHRLVNGRVNNDGYDTEEPPRLAVPGEGYARLVDLHVANDDLPCEDEISDEDWIAGDN